MTTPPRVPWPERPEVIERHCTCIWVHSERADGSIRSRIHYADPECKLHAPGHDLPPEFP